MSVLADIYISRNDDAVKYDAAPDEFADRVQYKGITPLELSTLWSIMRGVEWDAAMMDQFPCLLEINDGERLIHRLPAAMISELATIAPDRVTTLTSAWAATEELNCDSVDIKPVVDDLVRLSQRATETGQSVHLWNCV